MTPARTAVWKTGDTGPVIATLRDSEGTPVNLTGATVRVLVSRQGGGITIDEPAALPDAVNGDVRYDRDGTLPAGRYALEFEVTYSSEIVETFPSDTSVDVTVLPDIG